MFQNCKDLKIQHLNLLNSAKNHLAIDGCSGSRISNVYISSPENSPNTDGIDIASSSNVQILDSTIKTGDDCVAINGGSSFINITHVQCGPGHGISVGSLGSNGAHETVEEVHVSNCNLTNTMYGLRIKTWQGGSGYVRKIAFDQINVINVGIPIFIDQYYCNGGNNCGTSKRSGLQVSDVSFRGVTGTSSSRDAIKLICSRTIGCYNILMQGISIRPGLATCINAHGRAFQTVPALPCLSP
ncbi:hypothetical protein GIB67_017778 [Kingdonia uniflora]|uniref:Polygalacturonase n=1 Tax=Kingdonia uniflora TaxID=39325 RepID=A0A7J7MPF5_9MAGN|nr:hypothetical protein GIB67_017778 [Kingdonia uniflora]